MLTFPLRASAAVQPTARLVWPAVFLVLVLLLPASASAGSFSATSGTTTATVSFTEPDEFTAKNLRLTIVRSGATVYDQPATSKPCPDEFCKPTSFFAADPELEFVELTGSGEPELVLNLFTGGANCCVVIDIYAWNGSGYERTTREFSGATPRQVDLNKDGMSELLSSDGRFRYKFTSGAASYSPVQVLSFAEGRYSDVTSNYPALITSDAARALKFARRQCRRADGETLGGYAGWAANQYRLGKRRQTLKTLRAEQRRGCLRSTTAARGGATFIRKVDRFIGSLGVYRPT